MASATPQRVGTASRASARALIASLPCWVFHARTAPPPLTAASPPALLTATLRRATYSCQRFLRADLRQPGWAHRPRCAGVGTVPARAHLDEVASAIPGCHRLSTVYTQDNDSLYKLDIAMKGARPCGGGMTAPPLSRPRLNVLRAWSGPRASERDTRGELPYRIKIK